jgi:hypothetical protein
LSANQPFKRRDLRLIFLQQVGCLYVVIQPAGLKLANPDPDQLPRYVVPLRQCVQRLSRDELLSVRPEGSRVI